MTVTSFFLSAIINAVMLEVFLLQQCKVVVLYVCLHTELYASQKTLSANNRGKMMVILTHSTQCFSY